MSLLGAHGLHSVYGYGGDAFCNLSGGFSVPFSGSLGEVPGHGVSDYGYFSSGAGGGNLLDGILSCDRPPGAGGR